MKRQFPIYIDDDVREKFEEFSSNSMEPTKYLAAWVTELSKVKSEYALKVLGLIPDEWKHHGPGRPRSTTRPLAKRSKLAGKHAA